MNYLLAHWSYDPFLIVAVAVAVVHERGVRQLNRRAPAASARRRRRRSLWFYLGLVVLLVAVESPLDYWADYYFWIHMIQHLLLIFAAPVPIVAGAPWQPIGHGLPAPLRRRVLRAALAGPAAPAARRALAGLRSPWLAVGGLNAVLVIWHLPGPFDLAEDNQAVHIWGMHGSFFLFGVLFWLLLVPSRPFRFRVGPPGQMLSVFITANVMWFLAMALSLFSSSSWYPWYQHRDAMQSAFADQQIGAGIMWTCGIFWAVPAMIVAVQRLIDQQGSVGAVFDSLTRGRHGHAPGSVHALLALRDDAPAAASASTTQRKESI